MVGSQINFTNQKVVVAGLRRRLAAEPSPKHPKMFWGSLADPVEATARPRPDTKSTPPTAVVTAYFTRRNSRSAKFEKPVGGNIGARMYQYMRTQAGYMHTSWK